MRIRATLVVSLSPPLPGLMCRRTGLHGLGRGGAGWGGVGRGGAGWGGVGRGGGGQEARSRYPNKGSCNIAVWSLVLWIAGALGVCAGTLLPSLVGMGALMQLRLCNTSLRGTVPSAFLARGDWTVTATLQDCGLSCDPGCVASLPPRGA
jgi:hypothetical protein